jgi:hypothetical protein
MKFRQALFWDVNPNKIDVKKNTQYIIERILDFGNDSEVRWLVKKYDKAVLKKTVAKSRTLTPRSKSLWTLMFKTK